MAAFVWENYWSDAAWDPTKWEIRAKANKDLTNNPFNNVMSAYADWAANMSNHLRSCNQGYGKILHMIQLDKHPLTYQRLSMSSIPGVQVDLLWTTRAL